MAYDTIIVMTKNKTTEKKVAKPTEKKVVIKQRQYKVLVLNNTLVEGRFCTAGTTVVVSKDYYERVKAERDNQLKII